MSFSTLLALTTHLPVLIDVTSVTALPAPVPFSIQCAKEPAPAARPEAALTSEPAANPHCAFPAPRPPAHESTAFAMMLAMSVTDCTAEATSISHLMAAPLGHRSMAAQR